VKSGRFEIPSLAMEADGYQNDSKNNNSNDEDGSHKKSCFIYFLNFIYFNLFFPHNIVKTKTAEKLLRKFKNMDLITWHWT